MSFSWKVAFIGRSQQASIHACLGELLVVGWRIEVVRVG